jgi:hypothetical protein
MELAEVQREFAPAMKRFGQMKRADALAIDANR